MARITTKHEVSIGFYILNLFLMQFSGLDAFDAMNEDNSHEFQISN